MKPAVINVDLAWGAACDLVLLVQDAAGVPLNLSGASLDFYLKAGDASVPLAVDAADAAEGLVRVRVPGQDLGMCPWEGWLQTSPETPKERILRGLMTVTDKVLNPRAEGNPSTHRYFVRLSDAVTVSVDSVDLAWWAYAHALKAQERMESLADSWPETVSDGEQQIIEARNEAVTAVQDKQAASVLAVGRASQTAQQNIASAQADAVAAVQETEEEAQGTITPLVQRAETAKDDIDQAERRINTAAMNAATSATSAANSATAAQQALAAMPQVDASGNMTLSGGLTTSGVFNANGGCRTPSSTSVSAEALNADAMLLVQARQYVPLILNGSFVVKGDLAQHLERNLFGVSGSIPSKHGNITILKDYMINNVVYPGVLQFQNSVDGLQWGGVNGSPYTITLLTDYEHISTLANILGVYVNSIKDCSICIGSSYSGYSFSKKKDDACWQHPIHWANDGIYSDVDYGAVENFRAPRTYVRTKEHATGWAITLYPFSYLGSTKAGLLRGTNFGINPPEYFWAILPPNNNFKIAVAEVPKKSEGSGQSRYELFVDKKYVMAMFGAWCGTGHTASFIYAGRANNVAATRNVPIRLNSYSVISHGMSGKRSAGAIMEEALMSGVTAKPVPTASASSAEISASGGDITLTVSSTLKEVVYVLNDTMCAEDPDAVWCTQSAEEIPAGGGSITLTVAANTGSARELWVFVGHQYGQCAVVKINQEGA